MLITIPSLPGLKIAAVALATVCIAATLFIITGSSIKYIQIKKIEKSVKSLTQDQASILTPKDIVYIGGQFDRGEIFDRELGLSFESQAIKREKYILDIETDIPIHAVTDDDWMFDDEKILTPSKLSIESYRVTEDILEDFEFTPVAISKQMASLVGEELGRRPITHDEHLYFTQNHKTSVLSPGDIHYRYYQVVNASASLIGEVDNSQTIQILASNHSPILYDIKNSPMEVLLSSYKIKMNRRFWTSLAITFFLIGFSCLILGADI